MAKIPPQNKLSAWFKTIQLLYEARDVAEVNPTDRLFAAANAALLYDDVDTGMFVFSASSFTPTQINVNLFILFNNTLGTVRNSPEFSLHSILFHKFSGYFSWWVIILPSCFRRCLASSFKLFNFNLYFYELKLVQFILNEGTEGGAVAGAGKRENK